MASRNSFAFEEWYHCFNRGVDKRSIFENEYDANRFMMLLYLANNVNRVDLYNTVKPQLTAMLQKDRGDPLVAIGAYCLMPNHYHLLLKEIVDGGITTFMRKVGTAYTMYFNAKYERIGHLFSGSFRSRHVHDDRYLQKVAEYIHCNPAELYAPGWQSGKVGSMRRLEIKLCAYPYSSLSSYVDKKIANPLLSADGLDIIRKSNVSRMLEDARDCHAEIAASRFER